MGRNRRAQELLLKILFGSTIAVFLIIYANSSTWRATESIGNILSTGSPVRTHTEFDFDNITLPPKGYLVWSESCRIPRVEPFTEEILKVYKPLKPINCSYGEKLIVKKLNNRTQRYQLHINMHLRWNYVGMDDMVSCCYKEIMRAGREEAADQKFRLLPCYRLHQDFDVPVHIESMIVECRSVGRNEVVYKDAHFFIQEKHQVRARLMDKRKLNTTGRFGVLMIGIDSVSQFNFRRTMPKTFKHLQANEWFEMSGYNKMDDNTFPNLMAMFAGLNLTRATELCKPREVGGLDNCSTSWKLFRQNGFVTAYAEDETPMSTFNYLKNGFKNQPTDYYLRPFMMAIEKNLRIKKLTGMKFCIGLRRAAEYIYDFGLEFASRFLQQRFFGLLWANSFSHNSYEDPSAMDARIEAYLNEIESRGILDHSVVIFFSDHGSRWGTIRNMKEGFLEERLPMFFMSLPESMQMQHPDFVYALTVNKHRLTSPYDIHMTLKHLLALSTGSSDHGPPAESCPSCQSILKLVPENRTCEQAGIADHWCTCKPYETVSIYNDKMKTIAKLVTNEINVFLQRKPFAAKCSKLSLKHLAEANRKVVENDPQPHQIVYRIRFDVLPNEAEFEATFTYYDLNHKVDVDVSSISRLNLYAEDSYCIDDKISKKYCICGEEDP